MATLAAFLPWRDAEGHPLPRRYPWWRHVPATWTYAGVSTLLILLFALFYGRDRTAVPRWLFELFVYEVPALPDLPRTAVNLVTSLWLNTHPIQILYVLLLLMIVGVPYELREGTRRAVIVFYASSIFAGIVSGLALFVIHANWTGSWIDDAWAEPWTGGSAGAFGLIGATAARSQRPWGILLVAVVWEINVDYFLLRSYTPAFHFTALFAGFLIGRYWLKPTARVYTAEPASRETSPTRSST